MSKIALMMLLTASGADLTSTEIALSHPCGCIVESNPLMQDRDVRYVAKIAAPIGVWYLGERLKKKGYKKIGWLAQIAPAALWGYAAYHNLNLYYTVRW